MNKDPTEPRIYQPLPVDTEGGKCWGVSGIQNRMGIRGLTKEDATEIVRVMKANPEFAVGFYDGIKKKLNLKGGEKLTDLMPVLIKGKVK